MRVGLGDQGSVGCMALPSSRTFSQARGPCPNQGEEQRGAGPPRGVAHFLVRFGEAAKAVPLGALMDNLNFTSACPPTSHPSPSTHRHPVLPVMQCDWGKDEEATALCPGLVPF